MEDRKTANTYYDLKLTKTESNYSYEALNKDKQLLQDLGVKKLNPKEINIEGKAFELSPRELDLEVTHHRLDQKFKFKGN